MAVIETSDARVRRDVAGHPFGPWGGGIPGIVRLVRRKLDVSQRALAARIGVSQSQVARWETGRTSPTAEMLLSLARMAGLQLQLLDNDGTVEQPLRDDGARDRAHRRYPAHVDIEARAWRLPRDAASRAEFWQLLEAARERRDPHVRFHTSAWRKHGLRHAFGQPVDHPSLEQLVAEVEFHDERLMERRERARQAQRDRLRASPAWAARLSA